MPLPLPWVSPEIVDQILLVGKTEDPKEACGVITPDSQVVQLVNCSLYPSTSFELSSEDLVNALHASVDRAGLKWSELREEHFIIWHTHPGGNIGPSRADLKFRIEGFQYVVVSLPNGEAVRF